MCFDCFKTSSPFSHDSSSISHERLSTSASSSFCSRITTTCSSCFSRCKGFGPDLTPDSPEYLGLSTFVEKLECCDIQRSKFTKRRDLELNDGSSKEISSLSFSNTNSRWLETRKSLLISYQDSLTEVLDHLALNSVLLQSICFYKNKFYAEEDPEFASYAKWGNGLVKLCLVGGLFSLTSAAVIPLINFGTSTKFHEPIPLSSSCLTAAILFLLAAYFINVIFLLKMRIFQESRKESAITNDYNVVDTATYYNLPDSYFPQSYYGASGDEH